MHILTVWYLVIHQYLIFFFTIPQCCNQYFLHTKKQRVKTLSVFLNRRRPTFPGNVQHFVLLSDSLRSLLSYFTLQLKLRKIRTCPPSINTSHFVLVPTVATLLSLSVLSCQASLGTKRHRRPRLNPWIIYL